MDIESTLNIFNIFKEEWPYLSQAPWISGLGISMSFLIGYLTHKLISSTGGKSEIKITSPKSNAKLPQKLSVKGFVDPAVNDLQVLIYAATTRLWYPQSDVKFSGRNWVAECNIGDESHTQRGEAFGIIAISGVAKIVDSIPYLPKDAVTSELVTVFRK